MHQDVSQMNSKHYFRVINEKITNISLFRAGNDQDGMLFGKKFHEY